MKLAYGKAPHNERQPLVAVLVALLIIVGNIGCARLPGTDNPQTTATPLASISAVCVYAGRVRSRIYRQISDGRAFCRIGGNLERTEVRDGEYRLRAADAAPCRFDDPRVERTVAPVSAIVVIALCAVMQRQQAGMTSRSLARPASCLSQFLAMPRYSLADTVNASCGAGARAVRTDFSLGVKRSQVYPRNCAGWKTVPLAGTDRGKRAIHTLRAWRRRANCSSRRSVDEQSNEIIAFPALLSP